MALLLIPYVNQKSLQGADSGSLDLFTNFIGGGEVVGNCSVLGLPKGVTVDEFLVTQGNVPNENASYLVEVKAGTSRFYFIWLIGTGGALQSVGTIGRNRTDINQSIYD